MTKTKAEFVVYTSDDDIHKVIAGSAAEAAKLFETGTIIVTQVVRDHSVISYNVDPPVFFTTTISPSGAETAGAKAYPGEKHSAEVGETIILIAVVPTGYTFKGWYRNDTLLSSDIEAEIVVSAPVTDEDIPVSYVATFEVAE